MHYKRGQSYFHIHCVHCPECDCLTGLGKSAYSVHLLKQHQLILLLLISVLVAPLIHPRAVLFPCQGLCIYSKTHPSLPAQGVPFLKYKLWIYSLTFIMSTRRTQEETSRGKSSDMCIWLCIYGQGCGRLWLTFSFGHFKMINLPLCF